MVGLSGPGEAAGDAGKRLPLASLRRLTTGHSRAIGTIAAIAVFAGLTEAAILAAVAQVAAALVSGEDRVELAIGPLDANPTVGGLLAIAGALALIRIGLLALIAVLQARLASDVWWEMRTRLFAAFTRAAWEPQSEDREGHLQELMTSQTMQAIAGTVQLSSLVTALVAFVVLVASAMLLNPLAATIVVVVALILIGLLRPLSALGRRSAAELSKAQMEAASGIGESVRMAEETHVFGVVEGQVSRISRMVEETRRLLFRTAFVARYTPTLFQSLIYVTVLGGLAVLHASGAGQVGSLGAVVLMMIRAGSYGQQIQGSYQTIIQALPFVERLREATERYEGKRALSGGRPLARIETLAFRDVGYSYKPGEPVLDRIGFETGGGETIGVVGPSGAGKSTLVQLLLRLRTPDRGSFLVNGVPARDYAAADWHRRVAYVPQKPQLLHATVAENIRYFRDVDDEMVRRAARLARIDEDVAGWRDGYETLVGPRADSISGGQAQRICLARALAAAPEMLVLDEPTSALDPRSEALIQQSLREIVGGLTVFVVTHRMTMLAVCDSVLVLVGGRVDGFGATEALRRTNEYLSAA